jgi:hypothetical protein
MPALGNLISHLACEKIELVTSHATRVAVNVIVIGEN